MAENEERLKRAILAQTPTATRKADRTRLKCIHAAIAILGAHGMERFTYEHIAKNAGLSRQLVKNYYKEKPELLLQAANLVRQRYQQFVIRRIKNTAEPVEVLNCYVKASLRWATDAKEDARFWTVYYHYCAVSKQFKHANTDLVTIGTERIKAILAGIEQLKHLGEAELSFNAKMIQVLITGALVCIVTENLPYSRQIFESITLQTCRQLAGLQR